MQPILITGPDSLIAAALAETRKHLGAYNERPIIAGNGLPQELFISASGVYQQSYALNTPVQDWLYLTLPADWDKLMGILAELKKPKLPEYVRATCTGKELGYYKFVAQQNDLYELNDVYGRAHYWSIKFCTPITEAEFIEGGLKELADAGYVKGAKARSRRKDAAFDVQGVVFKKKGASVGWSGDTYFEAEQKGFCFSVEGQGWGVPVANCTLIPALPTTSQGIPYTVTPSGEVYLGGNDKSTELRVSILRHLLKQGITGLDTKAGRLTYADLELLTK